MPIEQGAPSLVLQSHNGTVQSRILGLVTDIMRVGFIAAVGLMWNLTLRVGSIEDDAEHIRENTRTIGAVETTLGSVREDLAEVRAKVDLMLTHQLDRRDEGDRRDEKKARRQE